jgi:hypothetical protein
VKDKPVLPVEPEFITKQIMVEERVPVLSKPQVAQQPARPQSVVGQVVQSTNGYSYQYQPDGTLKNIGYSPEVQAARAAAGAAIGEANRKDPNPTYTVTGDNNAFMPRSVQNSLRWQTGY